MSEETYSVFQFFDDGFYECVRRNVPIAEAAKAAHHYSSNVVARAGIIVARVIITDESDSCVFEWKRGEGITYPPEAVRCWP